MASLPTITRSAQREWSFWSMIASLLLVGWAIFDRVQPRPQARTEPRDVIMLTDGDLKQMGQGKYPTWSMLQRAYALSTPQMRASACRTLGQETCEGDPTEGGSAPARPGKSGQLILQLDVK